MLFRLSSMALRRAQRGHKEPKKRIMNKLIRQNDIFKLIIKMKQGTSSLYPVFPCLHGKLTEDMLKQI